ncbi:TPA: hypothetical protein ACIYM5_005080, partial [Escherichia coli]
FPLLFFSTAAFWLSTSTVFTQPPSALLAHLLYHVKVLSAQHVDVLSGVRTLRKQHVGWSGQSKW